MAVAAPKPVDDADLRCVAAVAAMIGTLDENKADPEVVSGLTAIFMYYLGKVDARYPGLDYAAILTALLSAPGYDRQLPVDLRRCGGEAEERGAMLKDLGERMKSAVPLNPATRPG
ncbi:hypothetical protein H7F51_03300 [Novosphingobium flavum]|uniref:Uncharacterized protein n=2 Tax=Novosphingobium flavum TaxID=1778672 RepID=A0A7X1KKI7_9SPHN|nr:hypothetical protein [Novosphingobium flavum]